MNRPQISLVMPAYNEGQTIEQAFERLENSLKHSGFDYELIVVDDGSQDDTRRKIVKYAKHNNHVIILGYKTNMGKGYATKMGLAYSKGESVIILDSDLNINPSWILNYVSALKHGDIIIASKWHPKSRVNISLIRRFLSHSFNTLAKLLTGLRLRDTQTGLKAMRRNAAQRMASSLAVKRYAFDVELLTLANLYGFKIIELPVKLDLKNLFNFREVWRMFMDLLGIAYRLRIIKYYQHKAGLTESELLDSYCSVIWPPHKKS